MEFTHPNVASKNDVFQSKLVAILYILGKNGNPMGDLCNPKTVLDGSAASPHQRLLLPTEYKINLM